jgi:uncharacterized protein (TIGR03663 family)
MAGQKYFYVIFLSIFLISGVLRFYDLTVRPIHHDDGVSGWFRENIYNGCFNLPRTEQNYESYEKSCVSGKNSAYCVAGHPMGYNDYFIQQCGTSYTYDPEYHGPFQYILGAWTFAVFGISDYTLRAPGCFFSSLTIILLLFLRKEMGDIGTLVSAGLLAVSPSMVYFSQFVYQDAYLIFFSLLAVVSAARFLSDKKLTWFYIWAAAIAIMIAVKESAHITFFSAFVFLSAYSLWEYKKRKTKFLDALYHTHDIKLTHMITALFIFMALYAFFYSNMFTNTGNITKAIEKGITFWLNRSTTWSGQFKPFDYYLDILWGYETAISLLSFAALFVLRSTFSKWCAWWSLTTLVIYSCIPYKTPWLDINFVLPMALLAGAGVNEYVLMLKGRKRYLPALIIIPLLFYSLYTAWDVTYVNYNDERNKLSYVSTLDDYTELIKDVSAKADILGKNNTNISIVVTDPWPLPWSLRDYKVSYGGSQLRSRIIIAEKDDYSIISSDMRKSYDAPRKYEIRKWMYVYVYSRKDGY